MGREVQLVRDLTIGAIESVREADLQRALEGLAETEEQILIEVSGTSEEFGAWTEVHLRFDNLFVDATDERDTPYDRPFFTYGTEIERGGPVALAACITRWDVNERNETTGCMISIAALATDEPRTFRGQLHARFQGYGMPADVYGDDGESLDVE